MDSIGKRRCSTFDLQDINWSISFLVHVVWVFGPLCVSVDPLCVNIWYILCACLIHFVWISGTLYVRVWSTLCEFLVHFVWVFDLLCVSVRSTLCVWCSVFFTACSNAHFIMPRALLDKVRRSYPIFQGHAQHVSHLPAALSILFFQIIIELCSDSIIVFRLWQGSCNTPPK